MSGFTVVQSDLKIYKRTLSTFLKTAALCCLFLVILSCSPKDERPGLWLQGKEVNTQIVDWRFTDDIEEIAIETQAWYLLAHSATIWCVQYQGNLYLGSYGDEKKFWERNIARNPLARINLDGQILNVMVSAVIDESLTRELDRAYTQKYDMEAVFGNELPPWWFYRIEQQI